jgi:hypothetical protein
MKKLREIAKAHIARCEAGDMQAIRELADRLDGKPAQMLDLGDADKPRLTKIVHEFVHLDPQPRQGIEQQELTVGWKDVTGVNSHANAAAT